MNDASAPKLKIPQGGPLNLDAAVAEFMLAHLDAICAEPGPATRAAVRRRDGLLASMGAAQRENAIMAAKGIQNLCLRA